MVVEGGGGGGGGLEGKGERGPEHSSNVQTRVKNQRNKSLSGYVRQKRLETMRRLIGRTRVALLMPAVLTPI